MSTVAGPGSTGETCFSSFFFFNFQYPLIYVIHLLTRLDTTRGCVSGAQLVNIQDLCRKDDDSYDFDMIDGYDELG